MNRTHRLLVLAIVIAVIVVGVQRRQARREMRAVPPPDTAVAGAWAATIPPDGGRARTIMLRLTGALTARLETDALDGTPPAVDTGAWTKDDAGRVVVTLVPRTTAAEGLDTLRFAVHDDQLEYAGGVHGPAGLTLTRKR